MEITDLLSKKIISPTSMIFFHHKDRKCRTVNR